MRFRPRMDGVNNDRDVPVVDRFDLLRAGIGGNPEPGLERHGGLWTNCCASRGRASSTLASSTRACPDCSESLYVFIAELRFGRAVIRRQDFTTNN